MRHFYIQCIILPRQARDKHRKRALEKSGVFRRASRRSASPVVFRSCGAFLLLFDTTALELLLPPASAPSSSAASARLCENHCRGACDRIWRCFAQVRREGEQPAATELPAGAKNALSAPFYTKNAIILPRHARGRHRETTQKEISFVFRGDQAWSDDSFEDQFHIAMYIDDFEGTYYRFQQHPKAILWDNPVRCWPVSANRFKAVSSKPFLLSRFLISLNSRLVFL